MNYINIEEKKIIPVINQLNILLADYSIYYQNLRSFHWNILGNNFFDLHNKFEELYDDAKLKIDEIAERILTLRYHPISSYNKYIEISRIKEVSPILSDYEMVEITLQNHSHILKQLKKTLDTAQNAEDEGTMDVLGSYIAELEKSSWMLNAWYKKTSDHLKMYKAKELVSI